MRRSAVASSPPYRQGAITARNGGGETRQRRHDIVAAAADSNGSAHRAHAAPSSYSDVAHTSHNPGARTNASHAAHRSGNNRSRKGAMPVVSARPEMCCVLFVVRLAAQDRIGAVDLLE